MSTMARALRIFETTSRARIITKLSEFRRIQATRDGIEQGVKCRGGGDALNR